MHFPVATPNLSYSAACVSASKLQICHCHLCHDQFPFPSRCWAWWATRWCWGNPSSCGATATEARCPSSTPCSAPTGTLPGRRWRRPRSEPSLTSRPSTRRRASKTSCAAQITASAGWTKRGKCYAPPLSVRHMQQPGQHIGEKKKVKTWAECPIFLFCFISRFAEPVSKPALHFRPMMGDVAEGQEVTLVCSVQGGSLPVSFTWYSAKEASSLDSVTVNKLEASHKITEVRRDHQGGYYCVSNNAANEAKQSPTVTIAGGCFLNDVLVRWLSGTHVGVRKVISE